MLTFITKRSHLVEEIRTISDINEVLDFLSTVKQVGIDIETTSLDPYLAEILLVSIGDEHHQYVIDATSIDLSFINDYNGLFIGHNIKYDYTVLKVNGIILQNVYDTLITEQRLGLGSGRRNSLDVVIQRRLGITIKSNKKEIRSSFIRLSKDTKFTTEQIIYSGEDVEHLIPIKLIQETLVEKFNMNFLIYEIEQPLVKIIGDAELNGLDLDEEKWVEIIKSKEKEEKELEQKLYEILGDSVAGKNLLEHFKSERKKGRLGLWIRKSRINFNSSSQLKKVFEGFNIPVPKGTRKNQDGEFEETETVGIKNLQLYLNQNPDTPLKDFLKTYVRYKKVQKHLSSFGYNYIQMINPVTKKLHTTYRQAETDTARLSSGDTKNNKPNFQQIPKLTELRHCFSYKGYKILTIDLSSAELVILGSKAQDFKLIELNEGDMHSYLAQASWRKILNDDTYIVSKEINSDKRTTFKNVNYGILYGAGVPKIAETLNVSISDANIVFDVLKSEIPNTFNYMSSVSDFALRNGYIIFNERTNSRRWFPDRKQVGKIKRAAINSPIQGSQADMFKEATVEAAKQFKDRDVKFLMFTHDEWVIAFKDDDIPDKMLDIVTTTANKYLNGVKMKASYVVKDTWTKE